MAINDFINSYAGATVAFKASYGISAVLSGAIIAGFGSWFLVRSLARTGALSRFAAGRETAVVSKPAED
jgi:energy-coupling factor transport system substrate-specific component